MVSPCPVFALVLLTVLLCLTGCTGSPQAPPTAPPQTAAQAATTAVTAAQQPTAAAAVVSPPGAAVPAPAPAESPKTTAVTDGHYSKTYSFDGTGDFIQDFSTDSDRTWVFRMNCPKAQEIFLATIKDVNGDDIGILADEGGAYSGSKSVFLKQGTYYLDVAADSPWTITMSTA